MRHLETFLTEQYAEFHERMTMQVKRKYREHESISVGNVAPVRNKILKFIQESSPCSKKELFEFILSKNEDSCSNGSKSWYSKNGKYLKEYTKNGEIFVKLSPLGQRVLNKIIL